jgi:hypothetical protein
MGYFAITIDAVAESVQKQKLFMGIRIPETGLERCYLRVKGDYASDSRDYQNHRMAILPPKWHQLDTNHAFEFFNIRGREVKNTWQETLTRT